MHLLADHGVVTTQATLSRDLRDMGITRSMTSRGPRYQVDQRARYMRALLRVVGMEIVDIRHNGSMVVVRTLSGRAEGCLLYTSPSPRDATLSRMPSSA